MKNNNISITLLGWEDNQPFPLRIPHMKFENHVTLLLYSDDTRSHYVWVNNINRLLASTKSHKNQLYFCDFCFHGFTKKTSLEDHVAECMINGPQKIDMPSEQNKWLKFTDIQKQLRVPIIIYADFETFNRKVDTCTPNPDMSSTTRLTHQTPSGFAYKIVGLTKEYSKPIEVYRGIDAADVFIQKMLEEQQWIRQFYSDMRQNEKQAPLDLTTDEKQRCATQVNCHICEKPIDENDTRVADHCHVTGDFRGAAHNKCNLNYKFKGTIPVVFHNLRGYDSHIIMQAMGRVHNQPISCIPNTDEKYISFTIGRWKRDGQLVFIDSAQFTANASLETLVGNLTQDQFKFLPEITTNEEQLSLLRQKGVYPYDYMDSEERFHENQLPAKDYFYNRLTDEDIDDEKYAHAQQVWNTFGIENLGQFHDLYVACDVLQLADVFESFPNTCLEYYHLDPAHFCTAPGLAWQAALKMTGVKLELLTDIDMHLMIEKGLRGGISVISSVGPKQIIHTSQIMMKTNLIHT